ncbi:MAG: RNA polymerase sigma factor [Chitinispirillia bacterium]|jgi:RNA polymerase sigma-70 factor (ECF subfamily)
MNINTEIKKEIEDIYNKYASLVHNRCRRILKSEDEAWDVTQEVFMKLMKSFNSIRNKQALLAWLIRTSTNRSISQLRRKQGVLFDESLHAEPESSETNERKTLNRAVISKLFKPWDKKTIEIIIYAYIDGYTQEEISEIMGMGQSTIRKYLTRFKRKSQEWKSSQNEFEY